jgi:hypothetical protein
MTDSDAWLDTVDDEEFAAVLKERRSPDLPLAERIFLLPPPPRPYWITRVREWAETKSLPVDQVDPLEIRVRVSRAQLLEFIEETFGPEAAGKVAALRAHVRERLHDDRTYLIVADEFEGRGPVAIDVGAHPCRRSILPGPGARSARRSSAACHCRPKSARSLVRTWRGASSPTAG